MLVDELEITLKAGHGGSGLVHFFPGKKSGPDGGNGGRGGDLYIKVTSDLTALNNLAGVNEIEAGDGKIGMIFRRKGESGEDKEIIMPVGTTLEEVATGKEINLDKIGEKVLICKGGLGGRGNSELKSSRNTTPMYAQHGLPGESKTFKVTLKLIADFGLIGLPSAGKSSLLNELTAASVKTAEYPFTTLEPNLGTLDSKVIADIPGLIEGASEGKGLGIKFLKHIEKVKLLLHCVTANSEDILKDYQVVRAELEKFNPELLRKPELILLTKTDLIEKTELNKKIKLLKKVKKDILPISIYDYESIEELKKTLQEIASSFHFSQ